MIGNDAAALLVEARDKVLRYSRHNGHPCQWTRVCTSPYPWLLAYLPSASTASRVSLTCWLGLSAEYTWAIDPDGAIT